MTAPQPTTAERHLSALHRVLLRWDVDAGVSSSSSRDAAAATDAETTTDARVDAADAGPAMPTTATRVPTAFASSSQYVSTYAALALEECAAIARRGAREAKAANARRAAATRSVKEDAFHVVTLDVDEDVDENGESVFRENDLVALVRRGKGEETRSWTRALGVVEGRDATGGVRVRLYLPDASTEDATSDERDERATRAVGTKRARSGRAMASSANASSDGDSERFRAMRNALTSTASNGERCWELKYLANISTVTREWLAIHAFPSLPYASVVLSGTPASKGASSADADAWTLPPGLQSAIERANNESQVEATKTALSRDPLVLIQGPPGTGKTRTILSLLSALLHAVPHSSSKTEIDFKHYAAMRESRAVMTAEEKRDAWSRAAPWMSGAMNPRDAPPSSALVAESRAGADVDCIAPVVLGTKAYKRSKILVCAPSNSALDEIVLRIMQNGLFNATGATYSPTLVRVGINVHHSVESVSMDTLVSQRLGELGAHVDSVRRFEAAVEREKLKQAILDEASVVCSTLSYSGAGMFSRMTKQFDAVIIDEAAQAVEPSTLIPLCHGAKQVFLVGDPRQLPATVLSNTAVANDYDMSMFKRFERCGYPVHVLKTQYRMHPAIREFPSKCFYDDVLKDGPDMATLNARPWHAYSAFRPFVFFDVKGKERSTSGHSWANDEEADFCVCLIQNMLKRFPELGSGRSIGVISPYKAQVKTIRAKLDEKLGGAKARAIDVNTIDGFQGREKDVCVFSVVRAPEDGARARARGLGFVADERRVNVGLTRARSSLFVVGSAESIRGDANWGGLVASATEKKCAMTPTKPYTAFFTKHTKEPDADVDREMPDASVVGEAATLASSAASPQMKKHAHVHVHDPHWTGAAEFIRTNALNDNVTGFATDGFRDELITENSKKGDAVGGDDDVPAGDVEDGDDANRDEFTETPDEPTRKKPSSRRARGAA